MAAILRDYPGVKATFNLTPVLMLQLEELANGVKDIYWVLTDVPADRLTDDEQAVHLRPVLRRLSQTDRALPPLPGAPQSEGHIRDRIIHRAGLPRPPAAVQPLLDRPRLPGLRSHCPASWPRSGTTPKPTRRQSWTSTCGSSARSFPSTGRCGTPDRSKSSQPRSPTPSFPSSRTRTSPPSETRPACCPPIGSSRSPTPAPTSRRAWPKPNGSSAAGPIGMWPGEGAVAEAVMPFFAKEGVRVGGDR